MEHQSHLILIFGGLLLGFIIWFWDFLKNKRLISLKSLAILIIFTFTLIHASPALMAHHQSQDPTSSHPCCMPQVADLPLPIAVPVSFQVINIQPKAVVIYIQTPVVYALNNKSPPFNS